MSTPWFNGPLLGFDTETTGVDPRHDRLVTAALVFRPASSDAPTRTQDTVSTWLANPGVEIPAGATAVHGITNEVAKTHGAPVEEVLEQLATHIVDALQASIPLVIFNASYDLTLMESELKRHGLATLTERLGGEPTPVLDPLVLDRELERWRKGKRKLENLIEVYGVENDEQLHTAEVDVQATLDVLQTMALKHKQLAQLNLAEANAWQARSHAKWARSFNQWLSKTRPDAVPASESWPLDLG